MHLVKLRALRPLKGDFGAVGPGDLFQTNNFHADDLEARGIAERFHQPAPVQPKMIAVPENKAVTAAENKTEDTGYRRKRGRR